VDLLEFFLLVRAFFRFAGVLFCFATIASPTKRQPQENCPQTSPLLDDGTGQLKWDKSNATKNISIGYGMVSGKRIR
jgi:hypothetical protein